MFAASPNPAPGTGSALFERIGPTFFVPRHLHAQTHADTCIVRSQGHSSQKTSLIPHHDFMISRASKSRATLFDGRMWLGALCWAFQRFRPTCHSLLTVHHRRCSRTRKSNSKNSSVRDVTKKTSHDHKEWRRRVCGKEACTHHWVHHDLRN